MENIKTEVITAEVPCQGCGKLMTVALPFIGCPFCNDCMQSKAYTLGSEIFDYNES